jgi:hypothetical protein
MPFHCPTRTSADGGVECPSRKGKIASISETRTGKEFKIFTLLPRACSLVALRICASVIGPLSVYSSFSRSGKKCCRISQCRSGCPQRPNSQQKSHVCLQLEIRLNVGLASLKPARLQLLTIVYPNLSESGHVQQLSGEFTHYRFRATISV